MGYWGDRNPGDRIDWDISFVNTSGVPTALTSGSAFCRQLPTLAIAPAGVLLTASGGLNMVTVFTASASSFYAAGFDYSVITATGNISGNGVQDLVLGQFSIQNRNFLRPTTAGRTLDVSAGGEAGVDWANVGSPTTAVGLTGTTIATVSANVILINAAAPSAFTVSSNVVQWRTSTPNTLTSGRVDSNVANSTLAAESYAADGAEPTLSEMLYMLLSMFGQFAITTTTISCKKLDGTTESMAYGMDNTADLATSRTRIS